jgi:hypothetical protein
VTDPLNKTIHEVLDGIRDAYAGSPRHVVARALQNALAQVNGYEAADWQISTWALIISNEPVEQTSPRA